MFSGLGIRNAFLVSGIAAAFNFSSLLFIRRSSLDSNNKIVGNVEEKKAGDEAPPVEKNWKVCRCDGIVSEKKIEFKRYW